MRCASQPGSVEPGAVPAGTSHQMNSLLENAGSEVPETLLLDWILYIARQWRLLIGATLMAAMIGLGATYMVRPIYTAQASALPPQPTNSAINPLSSLGGLSGLTGGALSVRNPADQYVALMQSTRVADRIVDAFDLVKAYELPTRTATRRALEMRTRIGSGRKDSMIKIEVDDEDPARAAAIANRYIEELQSLSGELALTEAQQRRVFFERELKVTKGRLATAQQALQSSGFNPGALRAEPKAAAEAYGRVRADMAQAEVSLRSLRQTFADGMPEIQRQNALLAALREQLTRLEVARPSEENVDYIGRLREYKYQEAMFEIFSRQYETARLDESREGALIQAVDLASPPELRARPKRVQSGLLTGASAFVLMLVVLTGRHVWLRAVAKPWFAAKLGR